jgi:MerR family copper efflux transcriptional regulator
MGRNGLFIGEVAARSGISRKAVRLYEAAEILPLPRRSAAGYRIYGSDILPLLAFVGQARRLGFTLEEIKDIVSIKRSGRAPCPHVGDLVRRKVTDLNRTLTELTQVRDALRRLLQSGAGNCRSSAAICPRIEAANGPRREGTPQWAGRKVRKEDGRIWKG